MFSSCITRCRTVVWFVLGEGGAGVFVGGGGRTGGSGSMNEYSDVFPNRGNCVVDGVNCILDSVVLVSEDSDNDDGGVVVVSRELGAVWGLVSRLVRGTKCLCSRG